MEKEVKTYQGSCHCGRVRFEIDTTLETAMHCNCSLCTRRGAVMVFAPQGGFRLLAGEDDLTLYQFNTGVAKHYFCRVCGIYTHHQPRTKPELRGVNAGCLEGVDPLALEPRVNDGRAFSTVDAS